MKQLTTADIPLKPWQVILIGIAIAIALSFIAAPFVPPAIDWTESFRPAALTLLSGHSPYNNPLIVHAPWGLMLLIPLAVLPEAVGRTLMIFCTLASFAFVGHRLGGKPLSIAFLLLSPIVMHEIVNGSIDWLAAIGFVLPPQFGLFFISIKPQIGIAVAPFWLVEAWRIGGLKHVIKVFAPFTIVLLLSFAVFGAWPFQATQYPSLWWNASFWPLSIPVGLALFVAALRKRRIEFAMAASPCLSPYVLFHSWVGALLSIVSLVPETIAAVVGLWIVFAMQYSG